MPVLFRREAHPGSRCRGASIRRRHEARRNSFVFPIPSNHHRVVDARLNSFGGHAAAHLRPGFLGFRQQHFLHFGMTIGNPRKPLRSCLGQVTRAKAHLHPRRFPGAGGKQKLIDTQVLGFGGSQGTSDSPRTRSRNCFSFSRTNTRAPLLAIERANAEAPSPPPTVTRSKSQVFMETSPLWKGNVAKC